MKKLLFLILFLPLTTVAQNTVTLPSGTTATTVQRRYLGTDSLKRIFDYTFNGYNEMYTATQINKLFRTSGSLFNKHADSLFARAVDLYTTQTIPGSKTFTGSYTLFNYDVKVGSTLFYPGIIEQPYSAGYDRVLVASSNIGAFDGRVQSVNVVDFLTHGLGYKPVESDSVIKNQTSVTQNAKFKISGDGTVGKSFVGDTTRMIQLFVKGTSITRAVGSANIIEADSGYVYKTGILKGLYTYGNGLSGRHTQAISGSDSSFYSTRNSIPFYKPGNYLMFELLVNDAISDSTIYTPATFRTQMDSVVMAAISRKGWPANHLILANTAYFNPPTALTFPNTEYRYSLFAAQMRAEATARGVLIYDDYAGFKTLYTADNTLLFTDILHPTPKGHTVIAQRFSAWLNTYISTLNFKTPISREAGTKEVYGDLIVRQNANVYNVNVINDLKTNSIMSPNALPIVIPSPLNTTVDVQTGTDNAAGRAFMANNVIYTGMGISTSVANWKARFNSRGVALSSVTTSGGLFMMGTTTPNNTTTFKPEISAWRAAGTRIYPEFTFRQHSTADLGFELLAGNGVRTPRIALTGEYGATASKVKVADSTILNIVKLPATSTQGSLLVRNTSGDVEQVQITGIIKGNGTAAPTAAVANTDYIAPTRTITTTSPLTGGGDLSANRTFGLAGLTGLGTANQILGMNAAATAYEYKTVTGGNGVSITQGVGSVTISATGNPGVEITGTTQTAVVNTIYVPHNAAMTTINLPATAPIFSLVQVIGEGAGRYRLQQGNATDIIVGVGGFTTVTGTTHGVEANDVAGTITLRKTNTNKWTFSSSQGTFSAY